MTTIDRLTCMTRSALVLVLLVLGACARKPEAQPGSEAQPPPADAEKSAPEAPATPAPAAAPERAEEAAEGRRGDAPKSTTAERAEPTNLAQAEAEFALAERELESALVAFGSGADKAQKNAAGTPVCDKTCRAFASLSRAAAAVCRLDAPNGARCSNANEAVGRARSRVASCACAP
jgi:hypothetical protein